ncbi:NAD(+) synthase [Mycoplasma anatis]|uniref:NH(3)-dependent NAD(+) synthetase n=1 Tax=Mycoplasmopsis anatis TaxID=171279 RepID=A0A9Q3LA67_9BACT|nr:NAD(+) synthase [Mycoplasmopsis anatis]MBW0595873.1 NAD(+) synthase [Mycoplasmopsis anatis]MBW0597028.1 NAD(+) synthase [Mycoplasmopsis anatis]MBW0597208.1 NAD(+) synthase [Mycoplasmopsis anatis]MBW0599131.1 NAD(+) synthase [Mycoplasmopsis anatis]MBW0599614.1 NAD(+) synthase [Mycoplasmopsis anatis]
MKTTLTKYNGREREFNKEIALSYIETIVNFLKDKVKESNSKGLIVGISGGIDSALVYALCKKAFPNDTLGVIMPIDKMDHDLVHIKELEKSQNAKFITVDLKNTFDSILAATNVEDKMSISNIKPRLRMTTLYALAQSKRYLVCGTDNKDEYFTGYFTKYGDGGVDLLPIVHLTKSEVKYLSELLNVPYSIINKKPSAGLWEGQSDEDELGFSYDDLDFYLDHIDNNVIINKYLDQKVIEKIEKMHKNSEHKRQSAYKPLEINKK